VNVVGCQVEVSSDKPITHPEESYRLWCVVVFDLKTSWMRRSWPTGGCRVKNKQTNEKLNQLSCLVLTLL